MVYSKQIKGAIKQQEDLLSEAAKEVEEFCEEYSWVANIQAFISSWSSGEMHAWRGQPTQKIEVHTCIFLINFNSVAFNIHIYKYCTSAMQLTPLIKVGHYLLKKICDKNT